jgi:hypothetical protein
MWDTLNGNNCLDFLIAYTFYHVDISLVSDIIRKEYNICPDAVYFALVPGSRVFLEKPTMYQLINKSRSSFGTRRLYRVYKTYHWILSKTSRIQSKT